MLRRFTIDDVNTNVFRIKAIKPGIVALAFTIDDVNTNVFRIKAIKPGLVVLALVSAAIIFFNVYCAKKGILGTSKSIGNLHKISDVR